MGRTPCCDKSKVKTGPWSSAEDLRLTNFIQMHGHDNWRALPKQAGLLRCGKSCRLRWINYLRPDVKRGNFTPEEEQTIINLHTSIGNKWSKIASCLPGRTDNEIKNMWNTHLKKRLKNEAKESQTANSATQSCTSSTITSTSGDDKSINVITPTHPSDHHNEPTKETTSTSDSATSSNFSSSDPNNVSNEALLGVSTTSETNNQLDLCLDDGMIEIPPESDLDFWQLFDNLDPLEMIESHDQNAGDNQYTKFDSEPELCKWLNVLESELGLTSDVDHVPKDGQKLNFEPEIRPELDCFPMWPCSPTHFGI